MYPVGSDGDQWWALVNMAMNIRVLAQESYLVS
jgi:hypothetical protein